MNKIRKGDNVIVIAGGQGQARRSAAPVDEDHVACRGHQSRQEAPKPNPMKGQPGGIVDKDMPIHISNVALFNPADAKGRPRRLQDRWTTAARSGCSSRTAKSTPKEA
jgi:large subunit ribosomal protein L24